MVNSIERAIGSEPIHTTGILEDAISNLPLGLIVFDSKREVVFCNRRYMEIYGLSSEQVRPGTSIGNLIQQGLGQSRQGSVPGQIQSQTRALPAPGTPAAVAPATPAAPASPAQSDASLPPAPESQPMNDVLRQLFNR